MNITLERHSYGPKAVEGVLHIPGHELATIERPWVPAANPGGKPFASCVPDGEYKIEHFERSSGRHSWRLFNDQLGVYRLKSDMPQEGGRFAVLIHSGNWVTDVVGCIAPGTRASITKNPKTGQFERAVVSSREAMHILNDTLPRDEVHTLIIKANCGAGGRL